MTRRLGKLSPRRDARTLRLSAYMAPELPAPLLVVDWTKPLPEDVGEMLNSTIGDCTCAGAGHLVQTWTANRGDEVTISDDAIVAAYSAITGYTPSDPATDTGAALLDVLNFWRTTGIGGHKIGAYASVNHANTNELKIACDLFGGLYTGVQLPTTAQDEIGAVWQDTSGEVGGWGGHCVSPETRVLTAGLEWTPIGDLKVGDRIVGFDERPDPNTKRQYREAVVEEHYETVLPCFDVDFSDGTRIRCSEDHMWLTREGAWIRTDKMRMPGDDPRGCTRIMKPLRPWSTDHSRDAGYLAAAFDGEGWIDGEQDRAIHKIGFAQKTNPMWDHVTSVLRSRGIAFRPRVSTTGFAKSEVNSLVIHGRQQLLEFLGSVRPHRLLAKYDTGRLGAMYSDEITIVNLERVGDQPVTAMRTSSRTFLAEGIASHNCVALVGYDSDGVTYLTWGKRQRATWAWVAKYADEMFAIVAADWVDGTTPAPSGFDLAQLQADLAAVGAA